MRTRNKRPAASTKKKKKEKTIESKATSAFPLPRANSRLESISHRFVNARAQRRPRRMSPRCVLARQNTARHGSGGVARRKKRGKEISKSSICVALFFSFSLASKKKRARENSKPSDPASVALLSRTRAASRIALEDVHSECAHGPAGAETRSVEEAIARGGGKRGEGKERKKKLKSERKKRERAERRGEKEKKKLDRRRRRRRSLSAVFFCSFVFFPFSLLSVSVSSLSRGLTQEKTGRLSKHFLFSLSLFRLCFLFPFSRLSPPYTSKTERKKVKRKEKKRKRFFVLSLSSINGSTPK